MAAPVFVKAGTGATDASGGAWSYTVPAPAAGGNLIIVQVLADTSATGVVSITSATNCTNLAGTANLFTGSVNTNVGNPAAGDQTIFFARSSGTSAIVITGANTGTTDIYIRSYEFSDVSTNTAIATITEGNGVASGTGTTISDVSVTTTGVDRLACQFVACNDDVAVDAFVGMTGGTWAEAVAEYAVATGTDGCVQLQIATMASAGTIDGGTDTIVSAGWGVIGFALIPAVTAAVASLLLPNRNRMLVRH